MVNLPIFASKSSKKPSSNSSSAALLHTPRANSVFSVSTLWSHTTPSGETADALTEKEWDDVDQPFSKMSLSSPAPPAAGPEVVAGGGEGFSLELHPLEQPSGLLVSVKPPREPRSGMRPPVDIVLVIDVSYSMIEPAPPPGAAKDGKYAESSNLIVLDLVKHSAKAILETLDERDRLSIVTFTDDAKVVQKLVHTTRDEKLRIGAKIDMLTPCNSTNMWAGLRKGYRQFAEAEPRSWQQQQKRKKRRSKGKRDDDDDAAAISALYLLTDGQPNMMCPPGGYVPALRKMLQKTDESAEGKVLPTIHTFGFGHDIRSGLLQGIAEVGGGSYAFAPDVGMVGTVFVNAIANLYSTFATSATLTLSTTGTAVDLSPPQGAVLCQESDNELVIPLSNMQYGQSRDFFIPLGPGFYFASDEPTTVFATLAYTKPGSAAEELTAMRPMADVSSALDPALVSYHVHRAKLCRMLASLFRQREDGEYIDAGGALEKSREKLQWLVEDIKASGHADDERNISLLKDLDGEDPHGQILVALSKYEYYEKWGIHYLPSLLHAHRNQTCNTFKDPGPLQYGKDSPLFRKYHDELHDLFNDIDVVPTYPAQSHGPDDEDEDNEHGGGGGGGTYAASRHYVSMAQYNSSDNPCFAGACAVDLADGQRIPVRALRAGMAVRTPRGPRKVAAVVRTRARDAVLCRVGAKLWITPYHPVLVGGGWVFPAQVAAKFVRRSTSVYSILLAPGGGDPDAHAVRVGGRWCVTLGHGLVEKSPEDVRGHAFFGDYTRVLRDLERLPKERDGLLRCGGMRRDRKTGLACRFKAPRVVRVRNEKRLYGRGKTRVEGSKV